MELNRKEAMAKLNYLEYYDPKSKTWGMEGSERYDSFEDMIINGFMFWSGETGQENIIESRTRVLKLLYEVLSLIKAKSQLKGSTFKRREKKLLGEGAILFYYSLEEMKYLHNDDVTGVPGLLTSDRGIPMLDLIEAYYEQNK